MEAVPVCLFVCVPGSVCVSLCACLYTSVCVSDCGLRCVLHIHWDTFGRCNTAGEMTALRFDKNQAYCGGKDCDGPEKKTKACDCDPAPDCRCKAVNCVVSEWSPWECNAQGNKETRSKKVQFTHML